MIDAQEFQTWLNRGAPLVQNHKQAKWVLGEWLLEADLAYAASPWYAGPGLPPSLWVQAAAEHYGYKYDTFLQFKRVAAAFPPATRVAALSWAHHQAVAAIDDPKVRAEWLRIAKFDGWSSKDLQTKVSITKYGLSMSEALKISEISAVIGVAPDKVQVLMVREFLTNADLSDFVFKHRNSFEVADLEAGVYCAVKQAGA